MSKSKYVHSRPHLVISEEDNVDANQTPEVPVAATNQTSEEPIAATSSVATFDMEIEHLRNVAVTPPPTIQAHNTVEGDYRSPDRRDDFTMASPHSISVASLSERMQTHSAASPGADGSQMPDLDTHLLINFARTNVSFLVSL